MSTDATALLKRLEHEDPNQRRMAALRLGALRDDTIADALVSRIAIEDDFGVREDLTWAIVMHIDQARAAVEQLLTSERPSARAIAAHVLSKVADPRDFERVVGLVADADPGVAIKAYRAAATTGGADAVDALISRLGDGDEHQRDALSMALVAIGEPALRPTVVATRAESPARRAHAAETLGHFGDTVDANVLADAALQPLTDLTADPDRDVRVAAVSALEELGEPAYATLERLTSSDDDLVAEVSRRLVATRKVR